MSTFLNELNKLSFILAPIFYKLLYMSVAALCIGVVIMYLRRFADTRISPFWKRALWLLVLVCLAVPYRPQSNTAVLNNVEQLQDISFREAYDQIKIERHDFLTAIEPTPEVLAEYEEIKMMERTIYLKSLVFDVVFPVLWFIGFVFIAIFTIAGRFRLGYILKNNKIAVDEVDKRYFSVLEKCKVRLGIKTKVNIVVQNYIGSPALLGIISPSIILPVFINDMDDNKVEYILLHELAHYKRLDILYNYLLIILQAVYWFNPFVWVMFRFVRQDMELANDAYVLKLIGNENEKQYSASLVEVLARYSNISLVPKLLCMVDGKDNMERRIKMIKLGETFKKRRVMIASGCLMVIGITAAVFLTTARNTERNEIPDVYAHMFGFSTKLQTGTYSWDYGDEAVVSDSIICYEMDYSNYGSLPVQQQQGINVYISTQNFLKDKTERVPFEVISINRYNAGYAVPSMNLYSSSYVVMPVTDYKMDDGDIMLELPNEAGTHYYEFALKFKSGTVYYGLRVETKSYNNNNTVSPPVSMIIQQANSSGVSIAFYNTTDNEYTYGEDYTLFTSKNGAWEAVPYIIENWGFNSIGYTIAPHSTSNIITTDWRWLYGELQEGDYRIKKEIWLVRSPGDYDTITIEADFTIHAAEDESNPVQQSKVTFWVNPGEPAQVIGEAAAARWLDSYEDAKMSNLKRIEDYRIESVSVIFGSPLPGRSFQDMAYNIFVHVTYSITTTSDEYTSPSDGIFGKGTFDGLMRVLYVKSLDNGNFEIVGEGTIGSEQEFVVEGNVGDITPEQIIFNGSLYTKSPVMLDLDPTSLIKIGVVDGIFVFEYGADIIALVKDRYLLYELTPSNQSDNNTAIQDSQNTSIRIDFATAEILSRYNSYYEYDNDVFGQGENIIIYTDKTIKDFSFIKVGFDSTEGQITFFEERILYSADISPDKPLVVKTFIPETIPHDGITFTDENNVKRYYYITQSGFDGSLLLVEFTDMV